MPLDPAPGRDGYQAARRAGLQRLRYLPRLTRWPLWHADRERSVDELYFDRARTISQQRLCQKGLP
jgi:hypothetical protein